MKILKSIVMIICLPALSGTWYLVWAFYSDLNPSDGMFYATGVALFSIMFTAMLFVTGIYFIAWWCWVFAEESP